MFATGRPIVGGWPGATGAIAFDMYGDNTTKILTVYKVDTSTKPEDAGKLTWVDVKTGEF